MYTEHYQQADLTTPVLEKEVNQMSESRTPQEMEKLAEQIGEFIHYWGFKRIHGRIWTHLFLAQKPLDAADLVRDMKISKALVSISLRELLDFEVVQDAGKSTRGTNLYRTNPDILAVILKVLREREKKMLHNIRDAFETLSTTPADQRETAGMSQKRLAQLGSLIQNASTSLEQLIALRSIDFGGWRDAFLTEEDGLKPVPMASPIAVS